MARARVGVLGLASLIACGAAWAILSAQSVNLARGGRATQSSVAYGGAPGRAIDGNTDGDFMRGSVTHTGADAGAWWQVDLGAPAAIDDVILWNRTDCCGERLAGATVSVYADGVAPGAAPLWVSAPIQGPVRQTRVAVGRSGRYVRVQLTRPDFLSLAEVEVRGRWIAGARADSPPPSPAGASSAAQRTPLLPSASPRVVDYRNVLRVTIPGGLLREPDTLVIEPIATLPRGVPAVAAVSAYEIALRSMRALPQPISFDFIVDAERLAAVRGRAVEPLIAYWDAEHRIPRVLFTTWDPATRVASAQTRHLTQVLVTGADVIEPYRARRLPWGEWVAAEFAAGRPVSAVVDAPSDRVLVTTQFAHNYVESEVEALARSWVTVKPLWPDYDIPRLVQATESYLQTAFAKYGVLATGGPRPRVGQMPVVYVAKGAPASYVHDADMIRVNTRPAINVTPSGHQIRVSHELFHGIQNRWLGGGTVGGAKCAEVDGVYPPGFWWIEASADLASTRVAVNAPRETGKSVFAAYPYALEYPLAHPGFPANDHAMVNPDPFDPWDERLAAGGGAAELEYQRAHFLAYLTGHGADFHAMNAAVLDYYRENDGPQAVFTPLDTYLRKRPGNKSLAVYFREFAAWYLLSDGSPLGQRQGPQRPLISVVRTVSGQERAADVLKGTITHTLPLAGGFTGKMWAVRPDPALTGASAASAAVRRRVKVTAVTLAPAGGAIAQVFVVADNARVPGDPAPVFVLDASGRSGTLDLAPGQTLYVVATNGDLAQAGQAVVRIDDVTSPPPPAHTPPGVAPAPTSTGGAGGTRPAGYWRLTGPRIVRRERPANDPSIVEHTIAVGESSVSGRITTDSRNGEGPSTWAGQCSWTWQAPGGLDRLTPGDIVQVTMSATDQSVPEKVSGWSHGTTGVSGQIRFDAPTLAFGVTHQAAVEIVAVQAPWKQSANGRGTWTVPAGPPPPEWQGRAALAAGCVFGTYARVYEWVGEGAVAAPAEPRAAAGGATPPATFVLGRVWRVKQWIGSDTWTWVWTRQGETTTFEGVARNDRTGFESRHAIAFVSEKDGEVIFSRPDASGRYIGTLSPDKRRVVKGIMDSVGGNQGWTAEIER